MHTLAPAILADLVRRHGQPDTVQLTWPITDTEAQFIRSTQKGGRRAHDVTLFIFGPDDHIALIQKHNYPDGVWRNPGGGVNPGEDVVAGARREALEETGLTVTVERYLLRVHVSFVAPHEDAIAWVTHVFTARTPDPECAPQDTREIRSCGWFALADLTGPIRQAILGAPGRLFRYRAWLHDACAAALAGGRPPTPEPYQT